MAALDTDLAPAPAQRPHLAACPGCVAAASEAIPQAAETAPTEARLALSLPTIHCQACISAVERGLARAPGVRDVRVNLTLKRALVEAEPEVAAADLIPICEGLGYEAHELDQTVLSSTQSDRDGRELLMRLAVAGFASMNVMLLSVSVWSGASDATRDMFHWISAAITFPAIVFSAQPFFRNAWGALRVRRLNMDVPIVLALVLALVTSLWETSLSGEHAYFDAALTLTFFLLAGRYLDHRTRAVARSAAEELSALEVPRALCLEGGAAKEVAVADLAVGDLILLRPGARMPVDGLIETGHSELDRALLTGESLPVSAGPGDAVAAGEVNLTGPLELRATAVGADTSLHQLADLVAVAESGRARYQSLADQAARLYAPGVHILSALACLGWFVATWDLRMALNIAAAVLIITCPCALGLAVPAVTTAASARLFKAGLLIKQATALERLAEVDCVVFDKTGTLTEGKPELANGDQISEADWALAMALSAGSAHPLAQAIHRAALARGVQPATVTGFRERPGFGLMAEDGAQEVRLGRPDWVGGDASGQPAPGQTATLLRRAEGVAVAFLFVDHVRDGAQEAVTALRAAGKTVHILSGDGEGPVADLAKRLGVDGWQAEVRPEQKLAEVQALSAAGRRVLMVGDGLNDTGALAAAHVSISPASALDAARVASDIVLLGKGLAPIAEACDLSRRARNRIRENFRIATFYNVIAVPLAIAGLATPLIAALAMSCSSITVSLNALRLGRPPRKAPVTAEAAT